MIHFDVATVDSHALKIGVDTETGKLYIAFNNLMDLFNFSMLDKTCDDVTAALLGTEYRDHIYIDEIEVFESKTEHGSKQLWVDIPCLKFLRDESNAPIMMDEILNFVIQNEDALKEELNGTLNDRHIAR